MARWWSVKGQNVHDKPPKNPTYCFSVLHRIKIKQYHILIQFLTGYLEMLVVFQVINTQITQEFSNGSQTKVQTNKRLKAKIKKKKAVLDFFTLS